MATTYLSPGVYVEEVDRGSKPIEGVGTAVAAFVGFTATPPDPAFDPDPDDPSPRRVTSWGEYTKLFGGFAPGAMLPQAVYGYFNNGGGPATSSGYPPGPGSRGRWRPRGSRCAPRPGASWTPCM